MCGTHKTSSATSYRASTDMAYVSVYAWKGAAPPPDPIYGICNRLYFHSVAILLTDYSPLRRESESEGPI